MQPNAAAADVSREAGQTVSAGMQDDLSSTVRRPRHAGLWVRFAASVLDIIIMGVPVYLAVSLVFGFQLETEGDTLPTDIFEYRLETEDSILSIGDLVSTGDLVQLALLTAMTVLLWVNWDGRTPGKKLTRIRIVSYPGYGSFGYGTAMLRTAIGVLSALPLFLGYVVIAIMIAGREDKRGYHDIVARTCVVHEARAGEDREDETASSAPQS